jgi:lipopolysaccharide export system protein LptC
VSGPAITSRYIRSPERTQRMLAGLRRRSLVVHFWRGALPMIITVALLGLGIWTGIRTVANMLPAQTSPTDIRMVGPEFHGRSKDGRPYTVTAESAVRDPLHAERSTLTQPRLVMDTLAHGIVHVSAIHGLYDEQSKILNLSGNVLADTQKNEHFASPTARVDTAASTVEGHSNVNASSDLGQTSGEAYAIDDKRGHVVLTGGVHTHLPPHSVHK